MLVGSPLSGFQFETRRPAARVAQVDATATLEDLNLAVRLLATEASYLLTAMSRVGLALPFVRL